VRYICAFVASLTVWGCVNPFAPRLNTSSQGSSILGDQHTTDGVFQNFKQAYSFKDTTIYGKLIASDFIFTYHDYDQGVDVFWGRDDEMRTTYGLFQNTDQLDLVWNNTISETGDSLKLDITRGFNLVVTFNPNDVVYIDGYADLTLERPTSNDIWQISEWMDESNF
jgi:hypothetical protein